MLTALLLVLAPSVRASAGQTASLGVGVVPNRLGHSTTIKFGFTIRSDHGGAPSPVTSIDLDYPAHIGIVTSGLGLRSCTSELLEALGPEGCPSQSLMGYGEAIAEVQVGSEVVAELARTAIFMAPIAEGSINLQFVVSGESPLSAQLVFPGVLREAPAPYGGDLHITVPLLQSFPEGPYVALTHVRSTIGPLGLTYYQRVHHEYVPYQPSGIILPRHCPAGGFPFAATFAFADGTYATSRASVPCRSRRHRPPPPNR